MMPTLKKTLLLLLTCLLFAPGAAAQDAEKRGKIRLALLPVTDRDRQLNREILSSTTEAFFRTRRFTLAERHQLDKIIAEKGLSGFIGALTGNPQAAGLEKLTTIDMIGLVDYTKERAGAGLPTAYWIQVRLISVETGEIFAIINNRREGFFDPTTPHEAAEYLFRSIREQFPPQGYVLHMRGDTIYVDIGKELGLKDGDTLEIIEEGEVVFSEVTGKPIELEGGVVGTLKVVRASNGSSACKLKKSTRPPVISDIVRLKASGQTMLNPVHKARKLFRRKRELEY